MNLFATINLTHELIVSKSKGDLNVDYKILSILGGESFAAFYRSKNE